MQYPDVQVRLRNASVLIQELLSVPLIQAKAQEMGLGRDSNGSVRSTGTVLV